MIILVDQDGPLADFESGFVDNWRARFPQAFYVPVDQRTTFYVKDQYPANLLDDMENIYRAPGFYFNLAPVPGCVEALNHMIAFGHEVRICSSPLSEYENCVVEKFQWIEKHFGREFTRRIILTKDKTLIRGDILIDDKPEIAGLAEPEWEHVLFECPYNREIPEKRGLNWTNWRDILCI